jgi:hypothetical protein
MSGVSMHMFGVSANLSAGTAEGGTQMGHLLSSHGDRVASGSSWSAWSVHLSLRFSAARSPSFDFKASFSFSNSTVRRSLTVTPQYRRMADLPWCANSRAEPAEDKPTISLRGLEPKLLRFFMVFHISLK